MKRGAMPGSFECHMLLRPLSQPVGPTSCAIVRLRSARKAAICTTAPQARDETAAGHLGAPTTATIKCAAS